jgi:hypothetical protein
MLEQKTQRFCSAGLIQENIYDALDWQMDMAIWVIAAEQKFFGHGERENMTVL